MSRQYDFIFHGSVFGKRFSLSTKSSIDQNDYYGKYSIGAIAKKDLDTDLREYYIIVFKDLINYISQKSNAEHEQLKSYKSLCDKGCFYDVGNLHNDNLYHKYYLHKDMDFYVSYELLEINSSISGYDTSRVEYESPQAKIATDGEYNLSSTGLRLDYHGHPQYIEIEYEFKKDVECQLLKNIKDEVQRVYDSGEYFHNHYLGVRGALQVRAGTSLTVKLKNKSTEENVELKISPKYLQWILKICAMDIYPKIKEANDTAMRIIIFNSENNMDLFATTRGVN